MNSSVPDRSTLENEIKDAVGAASNDSTMSKLFVKLTEELGINFDSLNKNDSASKAMKTGEEIGATSNKVKNKRRKIICSH